MLVDYNFLQEVTRSLLISSGLYPDEEILYNMRKEGRIIYQWPKERLTALIA